MKVFRMWKRRSKQRNMVRTGERNEQIGDETDEKINNVAANGGEKKH